MKLKFYLSLGVIILLTLFSAWWIRSHAAAGNAVAPMFLAMATDRDAGSFIERRDLVWRAWSGPADELTTAHYFAKDAVKPEQLVGAVLRAPLKQGQFVDTTAIVPIGDSAFLSAVLKPGLRAIAVPIDRISGSSGLIQPGNYVDVILARQPASTYDKSTVVAKTMVSNVRVIAINQKTENLSPSLSHASAKAEPPAAEGNLDRGTATLEVSPRQAELLATMRNAGDLSLSLRSLISQDGDDLNSYVDVRPAPPEQPPQVVPLLGTERRSEIRSDGISYKLPLN